MEKKKIVPRNITLAAADENKRDKKTNVATPSEVSVEQAKMWVDNNKL